MFMVWSAPCVDNSPKLSDIKNGRETYFGGYSEMVPAIDTRARYKEIITDNKNNVINESIGDMHVSYDYVRKMKKLERT